MDKLKQLQKDLEAGKITAEDYQTKLKQLLDDGDIEQDDFDDAKDFKPGDDPQDKAIYSQNDVDRIVKKKANQEVRKVLREAGVDLSGVNNKQLAEKLVELVKSANDKGASADEKELGDLRRKADQADQLAVNNKNLVIENAVLKAAGKYNPINPAQVVRALTDYKDLLEYDDESGAIIPKSVDRALKRVAEAEPNLFKPSDDNGDNGGEGGGNTDPGFKGKTPGGSGGGASDKKDQKYEANKQRALEMLGLAKKD